MRRRRLGVSTVLCLAAGVALALAPNHPAAQAANQPAASGPATTLTAPSAPAAADTAPRPNIVLISADDMRADDLEMMPRTKKIMKRAGVSFDDALSNYPLCCPARATLLTGQYSHNNGVRGNEYPYGGYRTFAESGAERETLPVWLQRAGYRTGFIGKYLNHYGSTEPVQGYNGLSYVPPGWDEWDASVGRIMRYYCPTLNQNGRLRTFRGEYQTDLFTRLTEEFVSTSASGRKPFFLWASHLAPHLGHTPAKDNACETAPGRTPTPPAERHVRMFAGLPLPHSDATNEADMSDKGTYMVNRGELDLNRQALVHEGRIEALQSLDESVAATIAALKSAGVLDDTVIIFVSDNGWLLGEHRAEKKILPYEESLRVPLLMRGPGVPANVERHQPVGLVDIPATVLALSGATPTKLQDGVSLVDLANDPALLSRRVMPIEAGPSPVVQGRYNAGVVPDWFYRGVRSTSFSYIAWQMAATEEEEVYNLDRDPYQLDSGRFVSPTELQSLRTTSKLLENCAGESCVAELPAVTEDGQPATRTRGDTGAPRIKDVKAPKGWVATTRPTITYAVADPTDPVGALRQWCSHQAIGCDGRATLKLPGEGLHDWTIQVTDPAGNAGGAWGRIRVDLYKPRVATPSPRNLVVETPSAAPEWRVTDSGSGVRFVDTRKRVAPLGGPFGTWVYPKSLQRRSAPIRRTGLPRGHGTVCLAVRAQDVAGRRTGWTGLQCRSRAVDAGALGSKPDWRTVKRQGWYAGTATGSRKRGATLTVPSTGSISLVRLVAQTGPGMGTLRVDVGGRFLRRLDLTRPRRGVEVFELPVKVGFKGGVSATVTTADKPVWVDSVGVVKRPGR